MTLTIPTEALAILAAKAARKAKELSFETGPNNAAEHFLYQSANYARALADAIHHETLNVSEIVTTRNS